MRIGSRLSTAAAALAAAVLLTGAAAWADHGGNGSGAQSLQGTILSLSLTATGTTAGGSSGGGSTTSSGSGSDQGGANAAGTPVGTFTLLSSKAGSVTVTVLTTTRFELTGAELAANLAGAAVNVRVVAAGTALDAVQVSTSNEHGGAPAQIRGTVTQVGNGSISIQTGPSTTVVATLDPNVVVTLNDGAAGTLADVVVNARVRATWQVQNGQMDVTAIRVLGSSGHGDSGSSSGSGSSGSSGGDG